MIIKAADFDTSTINKTDLIKKPKGGQKKKNKRRYLNLITAFDIETSRVNVCGEDHSIMYIWQWQLGNNITIIGRTWDEFISFRDRLIDGLGEDVYIVVWTHNLSYEFCFLSDPSIYTFSSAEVFAVKSRRVLRADMCGHLEFRCSYLQSNMSLSAFLKEMKVPTQKLTMDYEKVRYPWTELSDDELAYCVADVQGLVQAMQVRMAMHGDSLHTIPPTQTGYIRRETKRAMYKLYNKGAIDDQQPTLELYERLRSAYRGGDTHANRFYAAHIINNVHSADRSSSYPDVICNCKFPSSAWSRYDGCSVPELCRLMDLGKAILFQAVFINLRLRPDRELWPFPYLTLDKAENKKLIEQRGEYVLDNGRLLSCDKVQYTITDVDYEIIKYQYTWDDLGIGEVWACRYGDLPKPITDIVKDKYRLKTALKGLEGINPETGNDYALEYSASKAAINSVYGMMVQNNIKYSDIFVEGHDLAPWALEGPQLPKVPAFDATPQEWEKYNADMQEYETQKRAADAAKLAEYTSKTPLVYSWGVWVCAWARYRLFEAVRTVWETPRPAKGVKPVAIYCDTDSVKYTGDVDFTAYNTQRIADSTKSGAYAIDAKGIAHYMGVMEQEDDYRQFATLGAKKYAYTLVKEQGKKLHITIAGVNKKKGGDELQRKGGLKAFCASYQTGSEGVLFEDAGGTEILYNDYPTIGTVTIDEHKVTITRNAVIRPSTYKLGVNGDYEHLLQICANYFTNPDYDDIMDTQPRED